MTIKKFKKGDQVLVTSGRDKGKSGEILRLFPKHGTAVVKGVALYKRHRKATANTQGGIIEQERALPLAKLMVVEAGKPVRLGLKRGVDGVKRISKKSGKTL